MSIDREVNARVEAYSGNPQALQKKYAMTKELVDLLALQRIKKGMDQQRNNIAMAMQTNPATIKQQREKEVFARTAEDVAQQVGGTLKNMQRQRSQGLQRLAQRAAPQRGLGALMPQQGQRPQKRMMAATGGIVGFNTGELVEEKDTIETLFGEQGIILPLGIDKTSLIRDRIQYAIDTNESLENFSTDELQALQPDNNKYTPKIEAELAKRQSKTQKKSPTAESTIPAVDKALALKSQQNVSTDTAPKDDTAPSGSGTASTEPKPFDLQTALEEVGDAPTPVKVDRTGLEERGKDFLKTYGVDPASIDPEEAGIEALTKAGGFYGIKQKDAELRKGLADLAAIDAAQTDPEKLRREQLTDFLLGGAGRGRSALAGAGAAAVNRRRAQGRDIRSRQVERNEMLKDIQNQDLEIRKLAKDEERAAIERADNLKMEGLRIISTMSNAELSARQTEANAINDSNIANYQAKMERVGLLLEQSNAAIDQAIERAQLASIDAQRRGQIAQSGIDDAMRRKSEIGKVLEETYRDQVNADPTILSLRNSLADPNLSSEEAKDINEAIKKRLADIKANLAFAQQSELREIDNLNDKILELENLRNTALGGGISDIALSTEDEDLVRRNQPPE